MTTAKISARKCASNVIVSTRPDVCWTPVGSDVVKVGYSSIAFLDTAIRYSTSVRNNGKFDFQLNSRCSKSTGHEPGTKKGVVVPGYLGPAHVDVAAHFVFSEGWATCSHRDPAWINRPDPGPVEPEKNRKVVLFDDCAEEWEKARAICSRLLLSPNPSRSLTGGHKSIEGCAKGFVSAACGGNPV
ncbi:MULTISPECIES: PAAR-like domain-containing protein [Rhizobium/Agrobacterium group]|uniref:PAAR-like domain-containing protein n=1 Tax=Rhizobium/Agrobacterium group TaxID=227290 RepID=UPI0012E94161|nr:MULTISPECIES: PAAR-like domain-containing protein [Rhizobium/Agrobacterium group]MCF1474453.1 DUF4150 domain-containing protein [Allorhizobium ampelinum]MUZ64129.1 DUF4150 domain-containing protein [Agrobacterium vitis]MVA50928.1 DUF4150 domain-containing protein [Agrobacterium vitis]NSZ52454.1 DUF4150 domain-containing protein [Agrobacterium vitis]NTA31216.1 DUF4150 domain-containing protein [Agrobacterium vitis]